MSTPARSLGHVALHYRTADEGPLAARLLSLLGLCETQMLPLPGGNFYRFVVDEAHYVAGDGIVYLSCLPEPQAKLIAAIHSALDLGGPGEHESVAGMRAMMAADFEASFHLGFLVQSLDDLESRIAAVQADAELAARITIGINRPQPGDAAIDARLDASPLFAPVTRYAYGRNGVQVFVETDLLVSGQLGESTVLEFDYLFPGHESHILSVVEL